MTPDTIKNPEAFKTSAPPGFDGIFDWSFTKGCFGETKITPMDIDGIIERRGDFLLFETKKTGVEIPLGQKLLLRRLWSLGCFTIVFIWGKIIPEKAYFIWSKKMGGKKLIIEKEVPETLHLLVKQWYDKINL